MRRLLGCILVVVVQAQFLTAGRQHKTFALPDAVLLFGNPEHGLELVLESHARHLDKPDDSAKVTGTFTVPSLSHDGSHVTWGSAITRDPSRFAVAVYSVKQQRWALVGDFEHVGSTSISPDGSMVAFTTVEEHRRTSLRILDRASGRVTVVSDIVGGIAAATRPGWSPSGEQLVVELQKGEQPSAIAVVDVRTASTREIAKGQSPTWSPKGDWIAFVDEKRQRCILVRPDGSDAQIARSVNRVFGYRIFIYSPTWSPDGRQLLLNEMKGEGPNLDVTLIDIKSRKAKRVSRNGLPVFGWATAR